MASKQGDNEIVAMQAALHALSDLESDEQRRVLLWLEEKLNLKGATADGKGGTTGQLRSLTELSGANSNNGDTPKQFIVTKKPKTDVERITCLAYYLTHFRKTPHFKTKDLTALNVEAGQPKFSNAADTVDNATKHSQYLTQATQGNKQITARGESLIEALPDREKVASALEEHPPRRRQRRQKKKSKT